MVALRLLYADDMRKFLLALTLAAASAPGVAGAHARLMDPSPRFDPPANPGGIKEAAAPCGAAKPAAAAHTYIMGSTITVKINETIDHPGHYELWWSNAGDAAFTVITGMNNIANPAGLADATVTLTLPATAMDNATLQLRMIMTNTNPPTNYYSCADIKLASPAADLAGVNNNPDLAIAADTDLSMFAPDVDAGDVFDANVEAGTPTKKPPAEGAGVPGCSMGGTGSGTVALGLLMLFLFSLAVAPTLARRRR
jgi:hypothetical protein